MLNGNKVTPLIKQIRAFSVTQNKLVLVFHKENRPMRVTCSFDKEKVECYDKALLFAISHPQVEKIA